MTLLAGFSVLLYRYSWQEDLLIGCPVANRNRVEIEGMIGFFVNTLVQRIDLSGRPTFATLLSRVREVTLESQANQDVPFERLVEVLAPERDLSRNPLFQILFQLFPASLVTAAEGVLRMERVALEEESARFDLALSLVVGEERISGRLRYASDLFEPDTMERLLLRLERLLLGVVEDADRPLLDYPLDEEMATARPVAVALPTEDDFDFE
jgi:non-ribosomal peptide synthetase component F